MPPRTAAPLGRCLTDVEAAGRLGLTPDALRAWRKQKRGPDYIKGEGRAGTVRYPESWIDEWLESRRQRMAPA